MDADITNFRFEDLSRDFQTQVTNKKEHFEASVIRWSSVNESNVRRPYFDSSERDSDFISKTSKTQYKIKAVFSRGKQSFIDSC